MALYEGDIGLYLSGQQVLISNCNIAITQPKISQIVIFGENMFLQSVQLLGHCEKFVEALREGNPQLEELSDFQLLLIILQNDITTKTDMTNFFELIFPDYTVKFTESAMEFYVEEELVGILNPFNYSFFQTVVNELFDPTYAKVKDEEFNVSPANKKAVEIAEKLKKAREERAKAHSNQNTGEGGSLFGHFASVLSIGLNMDINVFYSYTPFQLYDAFTRYQSKLQYDLYQKIATTPLMDVSKMEEPETWLRDLYTSGVSSRPSVNSHKELAM